jgi:hypothetical protein
MPTRPAGIAAIPVGDEAEAAELPAAVAPMPAQVPEAVAVMPPPSKSEPDEVVGAPFIPPLKLPADELIPKHVAVLLVVGGLSGEVPDVVGLTPTDPSSVVPSGIPVGGTAAAGLMPSGDVTPSGDGPIVPIWAYAGPQRKSAAIAPISTRTMIKPPLQLPTIIRGVRGGCTIERR